MRILENGGLQMNESQEKFWNGYLQVYGKEDVAEGIDSDEVQRYTRGDRLSKSYQMETG